MEFCSDNLWLSKKNAAAFPKIPIFHFAEELAVSLNLQQNFIYNKRPKTLRTTGLQWFWYEK